MKIQRGYFFASSATQKATLIVSQQFSKIYPACQTDDNGIKPGSDLNNADKRAAEPSRAEVWGIKEYVFDV